MKRRIIVVVDVGEVPAVAMLKVVNDLAETLQKLSDGQIIMDYGIQLEDPETWFVRLISEPRPKVEKRENLLNWSNWHSYEVNLVL